MDSLLKRTDRELILTRELKAPREKVFAAWTDPALAAQWWCPTGCTLVSCEMDVRPGGKWHRRMRVSDGSVIAKYGVYREVHLTPAHQDRVTGGNLFEHCGQLMRNLLTTEFH